MAIIITLIVVALAAGYLGSRIERKRSSEITKREATELRRDVAAIQLQFDEHIDVHKVIKYYLELQGKDIAVIASAVGLTRAKKLDG